MRALIIIDVQNDFLPGGALGIPHAHEIIPIINTLIPKFAHVIATLDWHPLGHISFASTHQKQVGATIRVGHVEQILWPDHCLQNSHGADLAVGLQRKSIEATFYKGSDPNVDSYSAFFDAERKRSTGLADYLHKKGIDALSFVGLATEYCVLYSVLDALELGFQVSVIRDGCRAINLHFGDGASAYEKMKEKGATIL